MSRRRLQCLLIPDMVEYGAGSDEIEASRCDRPGEDVGRAGSTGRGRRDRLPHRSFPGPRLSALGLEEIDGVAETAVFNGVSLWAEIAFTAARVPEL